MNSAITLWLALLVLAIAEAPAEPAPLVISNARLAQTAFDPSHDEQLAVSFLLSRAARAELRWFDSRDLLIRTVTSTAELPGGEAKLVWDGRDEAGRVVPDEAYHYTIVANAADGATQEFDLTDVTGGEEYQIPNVTITDAGRRIEYVLPNLSRVNVRIGLRDAGPLLRSLVNWRVRTPGPQREAWDGKDASGVMNLATSTGLEAVGMAFKLPDNTVIAGDIRAPSRLIDGLSWGRVPRVIKRTPPKRMYAHSQQSYPDLRDFVVTLRSRSGVRDSATAPLAIQGITPIEVGVAPEIVDRLMQQRFEIVQFVDGLFVSENEIGFLPATWNIDAAKLSPGDHYLTVNLRGYEGTFGFGSLKVVVGERDAGRAPVAADARSLTE